jgi:GNAT superfamily N-acetyltransferase
MEVTLFPAQLESVEELQSLQDKCYSTVWCPCQWVQAITEARVIVAVDEVEQLIAGYSVCDAGKVLAVAVWSPYRRSGLGRSLLAAAQGTVTRVIESNLAGQLFLRECGWKCSKINKGKPDTYEFVPAPKPEPKPVAKRKPRAKKK